MLRSVPIEIRPLVGQPPTGPKLQLKAPWTTTRPVLEREARHLGAQRVIIEAAFKAGQIRVDGWPYANARAEHSAVVVRLLGTKYGDLRYEAAGGNQWHDSVRAVALTLENLRAIDRYGTTRRGEQYTGWKALPAATTDRGAELIREHGSKRKALAATHPDNGGDPEDFLAVQAASDGEEG